MAPTLCSSAIEYEDATRETCQSFHRQLIVGRKATALTWIPGSGNI